MTSERLNRALFFGNADRSSPQLSPDGLTLAYLAPRDGVLNVWITPVTQPQGGICITDDKVRGIRSFRWAYTGHHILFNQDVAGDENWHIYAVDTLTRAVRDLTPHQGVAASILEHHPARPEEVVLSVNDRTPQLHDPILVNVLTGESRRLVENPGFVAILVDHDYQVRYGVSFLEDGSYAYYVYDGEAEGGAWRPSFEVPSEDTLTTRVLGFDETLKGLYLSDSRGRDTAGLVHVIPETGRSEVLCEDSAADLSHIIQHPITRRPLIAAFTHKTTRVVVIEPDLKERFLAMSKAFPGEVEVLSMDLKLAKWVVAFVQDAGPVRYCLWDSQGGGDVALKEGEDVGSGALTFLFFSRESLAGAALRPMDAVTIPARDGLPLVSYLTLPPEEGEGGPPRPLPLVLLVHGGPWARDRWGYNAHHQHLASRGYAVLSVNFRGSTGFGKSFINAGDREWGGKMQEDLEDALEWAIKKGVADRKRVGIMGGSYGGYATLAALTMNPELFACGVDIVGPSNLLTFMETIPAYWKPMLRQLKERVGDPDTEEGRAFLKERSPLTHVEKITKPLLIAQGANDPRIKQSESDQIVGAMKAKGIPVTYVLYPDEGHGFQRPENSLSFQAMAEAFLHQHLGGSLEPIEGDLAGASFEILEGEEGIPGLSAYLTT